MVAAVALFAAVSCNKELPQEENLPTVGETVVYTASTDGADTKAVLNEDTKKSEWVAGDAITVHDGEKGWKFTAAEAGANVDFSNSEGFGEYRPVLAVYPAGTYTANVEAKTAKAYIPTWQQAQAGTYHSPAALAVAYTEDNTFAFKNAHALLKFTVNTDNVTHVIFHGNGSEAITGDVYVTLGKDRVESVECLETEFTEQQWNEETQQNEDVKVKKYGTWVECYAWDDNELVKDPSDDTKYFTKGQTYYIAVAPQKFEGGVTVKVKIDGGEELVAKSTTKPVETKINTILNLGEIKYEAPVVHEWAVAGTFNGWSTTANPMELVDGYYVAKNVTGLHFTAQEDAADKSSATGFQFVQKGAWKGGYGDTDTPGKLSVNSWSWYWEDGGKNIYVDGATAQTAYDIYLNPVTKKFVIVAAGAEMPEDKPAEVTVGYWAVVGSMSDWNDYAKMTLEDDWYVAKDVKLLVDDQFKFRADENWDVNRGADAEADGVTIENNVETTVVANGKNFCVSEGGFYSLYINKSATKVKVVKTADLPAVENWGVCGTFTGNWNIASTLAMTALGDGWYTLENVEIYKDDLFKFVIDKAWSNSLGADGAVLTAEDGTEYGLVKDGQNIKVNKNGKFTISLNPTDKKFKVVCVEEYTDLKVKIIVKNERTSWSSVNMYMWVEDGSNKIEITSNPGPALSKDSSGNYYYELDGKYIGETVYFIFSNNGNDKTDSDSMLVSRSGGTITITTIPPAKFTMTLDTSTLTTYWGTTAYLYVWTDEKVEPLGSWPGKKMTYEASSKSFTCDIPAEYIGKKLNFIVHNNTGWQTSDKEMNPVKAEQTYKGNADLGLK